MNSQIKENIFEEKQKIVIDILNDLNGYWDMAEGLLKLIIENKLSENTIDILIDMFKIANNNIKTEEGKARLEYGINSLLAIKNKEKEERIKEISDTNIDMDLI